MIQVIRQPISVILKAGSTKRKLEPFFVDWEGKRYKVIKFAFYHWYRRGTRKIHVLSLSTEVLDMRVEIDSESFECFLTEISDGLAD